MKRDYNLEERIKVLKHFKPDFRDCSWHNDIVLELDDFIQGKGFVNAQNFHFEYNFNPGKIIGSTHCNYYGESWIKMLENLKRFYRLPQFYSNSATEYINKQDNILLIKCGDNYFIAEGNHRLCIAKLLETNIDKVEVNEFLLYGSKEFEKYMQSKNTDIDISFKE